MVEWFKALDLKSGGPWYKSSTPPYCYLDLFSVVPSSTPRPRCVNNQLVSLPPVEILNSLLFLQYLVLSLRAPCFLRPYSDLLTVCSRHTPYHQFAIIHLLYDRLLFTTLKGIVLYKSNKTSMLNMYVYHRLPNKTNHKRVK